jgi:hypothetical protein
LPALIAKAKENAVTDASNPYTPPQSDISVEPSMARPGAGKAFSPVQAGLGTFLGGPLAGTYFLRANFLAMGAPGKARAATIGGLVVTALILLAMPFLPEKMPGYIIPIGYTVAARLLVERMQLTKKQIAESPDWTFQSNWRVAGVATVGFALFAGIAFAWLLLAPGATGLSDLPSQ